MTAILTHLGVAIIAAVIAVFVYRNNEKTIDPFADKIDDTWDKIKLQDKLKQAEALVEKIKKKLN